jgi:hypothetical protein
MMFRFPSWDFVSFVVNALLFPASAAHRAPDVIFQMDNTEVYKQSQRFATELQVRKESGLMGPDGASTNLISTRIRPSANR